jgi:hypothetical protein
MCGRRANVGDRKNHLVPKVEGVQHEIYRPSLIYWELDFNFVPAGSLPKILVNLAETNRLKERKTAGPGNMSRRETAMAGSVCLFASRAS